MMQSRHVAHAGDGELSHPAIGRRNNDAQQNAFDPETIRLVQAER